MPVTVLYIVCDHLEVTLKIKSWAPGVGIQFRTERTIILLVLDIEFLWLIGLSVDVLRARPSLLCANHCDTLTLPAEQSVM